MGGMPEGKGAGGFPLNFKTMKKQILIFAMLTMAIVFAGLKSYGQIDLDYLPATNCAPVTPLGTCADDDELHPIPGQTYTYTVSVTPAVGSNVIDPGYIQWFVYNATAHGDAIIDAGGIATAVGNAEANNGTSTFLLDAHKVGDVADKTVYNSTSNTDVSIQISWQSFNATANEILLVAYVMGEDGCSDNIEVWRIEPAFAFTLDIAGLMPDGTLPVSGNANECVSPVQDADYDGTARTLTMDYGENYVFFTVTAANFVHSWQPTITATSTGTTVTSIDWNYPANATTGGDWNAITAPVLAQGVDAVGDEGQCIIVRVYLDHGNVENNVASTVTLTVDGIMYDAIQTIYTNTDLSDLDPNDGGNCSVGSNDSATYDLTPRPNITEVNPGAGTFEPKN